MSSPRRRVLAAVLTAVVLLAPLAGCGGGNDKPKAEKPSVLITKMVDAITKGRTAKIELELGSSLAATAQVEYASTGTSMAIKATVGPQTVNVVLVDNAMYLQQSKGAKYLKIDKTDPALGSLATQLAGFGPKSALESLKSAVTKVADKGTETVDGDELHHFRLTVNTKKAKALFGVAQGSAKTPAKVFYDVWVDDEYRLRQAKLDIDDQKLLMKVSDWGKPVTIKAPAASQVMTR